VSDREELIEQARNVARHAYAPYSRFRVGAAVRDAEGAIFVGCNVENASYGLTICAERSAIFAAVAAGAPRPFSALALTCLDAAESDGCMPCGACRQVMAEHLLPQAPVTVDGVGDYSVAELLPYQFTLPEAT
jgi:cytidine deaminase